jgi:hypothetical protein
VTNLVQAYVDLSDIDDEELIGELKHNYIIIPRCGESDQQRDIMEIRRALEKRDWETAVILWDRTFTPNGIFK